MTEIEKTLENHQVRPTAMRILIYKYLAEKKIAVALTDIESAFAKAERTTLYEHSKPLKKMELYTK